MCSQVSPTKIPAFELEGSCKTLKTAFLDTPLGMMLAIADENALYLLEFSDWRGLERAITRLQVQTKATLVPGTCSPMTSITRELKEYFEGTRKIFETPLRPLGTPFQCSVWRTLQTIPYGHTRSYAQQALILGSPRAFRAVANANGANPLALVIPCHRIINTGGALGGYGGGVARKQALLDLEKKYSAHSFKG